MQALPAGGAMIAIQATEDEVLPLLTDRVGIAAINGPNSVVVSGDEDDALAVAAHFTALRRKTRRLTVSHAFHSPLMDGMLDEFASVLATVTAHEPRIPVISNLTGHLATELTTPDYWVRHVRNAVRFRDGVDRLVAEGVTTFLEAGPDAVLTAMAQDCVGDTTSVAFVPVARRGRDEASTAVAALAHLHTRGVPVAWSALLGPVGSTVDLPTYAFQRKSFWLEATPATGDVTSAGLTAAGHPLLGAAVTLADGDTTLFTARFGPRTHPWLADHAIGGAILVPGTVFVELAAHAAEATRHACVDELTLHAPLILPKDGDAQLQLIVTGERIEIYSRRADEDRPWTRNATGTLAGSGAVGPTAALTEWPPAGADPVDLTGMYERFAGLGYDYGPAFQGLRALWRRGDALFAEIALPDGADDRGFIAHPALLDAALHPLVLAAADELPPGQVRLPFSWNGVRLHRSATPTLRVTVTMHGAESARIVLADATGTPVSIVDGLDLRPVPLRQLTAGDATDSLYGIEWTTVEVDVTELPGPCRWALVGPPLLDEEPLRDNGIHTDPYPELADLDREIEWGAPVPDMVVLSRAGGAGAVPAAAHDVVTSTLADLRAWLADERHAEGQLLVVTRGAIGADVHDLASAPVWGLLRSAQAEYPDRLVLADIDDTEQSALVLPAALATGEPQLVLREGTVYAPRLARLTATGAARPLDEDGTVLVTGATGALGRHIARHLVTEHGARHLLLASRRGAAADGAAELVAELTGLGAAVTVAACDIADRDALAALLGAIPAEHPLTGVVHAVGVLADGTIDKLTPEQVTSVLRAKVDAAYLLHELTEHEDLAMFAVFSSIAGVLGTAGQANYAAANTFLDALAEHRVARGLPATSLAWGLWGDASGMAGGLSEVDVARMSRGGVAPMSTDHALALFDAGLASGAPLVVPAQLDLTALRAKAGSGDLARLFLGLVPAARVETAGDDEGPATLTRRLRDLPPTDGHRVMLELVAEHVAPVLGHATPDVIDPDREFSDMGFDSLAGVEFRNRLAKATGLRLPASLTFDHPTPPALADHLLTLLVDQDDDQLAA
jgi:acyl transferase domain-containing protein